MKKPQDSLTCRCGCNRMASFLCAGTDFGGEVFVDEPACYCATCYLEESAAELGLPFTKKRITATEPLGGR